MVLGIPKEYIKEYALANCKDGLKKVLNDSLELNPYMRLLMLQLNSEDIGILSLLANEYYDGVIVNQDHEKALRLFKKASSENNIDASFQIGWHHYRNGEYAKAIEVFQQCLSEKDALSDEDIGDCYANIGDSLLKLAKPEVIKSVEYLSIAVDKYKNAYASFRLGTLYSDSTSQFFDPSKAIKSYEYAATHGNIDAALIISEHYAFGDAVLGIRKNKSKALQVIRSFSDDNNVEAIVLLGRINLIDDDILSADYAAAKKAFKKALTINDGVFKTGYIESFLGYSMCMTGEDEEGIQYLIRAYEHGYTTYSAIIGNAYYSGEISGLIKDDSLAKKYFSSAFESKNINLFQCCNYAELLAEGDSNVRDYRLAYRVAEFGEKEFNDIEFLYIKAKLVLSGKVTDAISMYEALQMMEYASTFDYLKKKTHLILGDYYMASKDYRKAETHYLGAFDEGEADAGLKLARLYENGAGTIQASISKCMEWYRKAADAGSEEAREELGCFTKKRLGGYKRVRNTQR